MILFLFTVVRNSNGITESSEDLQRRRLARAESSELAVSQQVISVISLEEAKLLQARRIFFLTMHENGDENLPNTFYIFLY